MIPTGLKNIIGPTPPSCDPRPLRGGKGLSFDGVDGNIYYNSNNNGYFFEDGGDYSVKMVFKPTQEDKTQGLFGNLRGSLANNNFGTGFWQRSDGRFYIDSKFNSLGFRYIINDIIFNEINTIVFCFENLPSRNNTDTSNLGKVKIFLNGVKLIEDTNAVLYNYPYFSSIASVRKNDNIPTDFFNGDIYNVCYYNRYLTDDECLQNYIEDSIFNYNLEEENGSTVFDSSGNDNHGVLSGGVVRINPLSQHTFKSDNWLVPNFDINNGNIVSYPPDTFRVSAYYKYMQTSETYDLTNNGCLIFKTTIPDLAQRFYINFNSKSSWTSNVNGLRIAVDGALNVYLNSSSVAAFSFDVSDGVYFVISNQGCYLINISNGFISDNLGVPNDLNQPISLSVGIDSNKDLNAEFWQTNLSIDDVLKTFKPIYSRADEVGYSGYFDIFNLTDYNYWSYTTNVYNLSLDSPNFVDTDICTILSNKAFEFKAGSYGNGALSLSYVFPRITNNQDLRHTLFPNSLVKYKIKAKCTQLEGDLGQARIYFVKSNGQVNMVESFVNGVATFDYEGDMYLKDAASNAYLQFRKNNATNYKVRWEVQEFTMEIIAPRDESNTDFDILGNGLQFTGKACGANE